MGWAGLHLNSKFFPNSGNQFMIIPALIQHLLPPHPKLTAQGPFAKPVSQVCDSIFPSGTNLVNAVLYSNEQGGQLNKMDVDWIDFHYKKQTNKNTNCISAQFLRRAIYTDIKKKVTYPMRKTENRFLTEGKRDPHVFSSGVYFQSINFLEVQRRLIK